MAVQNFPPNVVQRIQPRMWTLDANQPSGTSVQVSNWNEVYSSDLITVINTYNNGIGTNVQVGQDIGFLIEKDHAGAPDSDPSLIDTKLNNQLYLDTNPGSSSGLYYFQESFQNIAFQNPGQFAVGKTNTLSFFGGRNYADSYVNEGFDFDPSAFGDHRLVIYARNGVSDFQTVTRETFELRGLAITNLKSTPERIEVDGTKRQVTITGDITVYPNPTDNNGATAWTPQNDIHWRVTLKSQTIPENDWVVFESGVNGLLPITPNFPDSEGKVGSFSVTWDGLLDSGAQPPYGEGDVPLIEMIVEARALTEVSNPTRNVITPPATIGVWCKKCENKTTNPFAEFSETIDLFDGGLSDLSVPLNYTSSESSNEKGSMGYGWFSTENIKIFRPLGNDTDLVYCDESGMCRRWVLDSGSYIPVLPDNRMTISVNSGSTNARYVVRWRDGSRREFDSGGDLRKAVDRNGHATDYARSTSYLSISDGKGRVVYIHFDLDSSQPPGTYQVQPSEISDSATKGDTNARRYLLDYYNEGTEQARLRSITDPVGDTTLFVYNATGRVSERREILTDHTRSVFYTYDSSNTGRLASVKASSTLLQSPGPDIVTDHFMVEYEYNVPFDYDKDGAGPEALVTYTTTKMTATDLEDSSNPPRVTYLAYDSLGRTVGEFEEVLDDTDSDGQIDDLSYIATLHFYNDPNDPWLRTKTEQINKASKTEYEYTSRGNLKRVTDDQENVTEMTYVEEVTGHGLASTFPDFVTEIRRPAPDRIGAPTTFYPTTKFSYDSSNGNLSSVVDAQGNTTSFRYKSNGQVDRIIDRRGFKTYLIYDARDRLKEIHVQKSLAPTPSITELVNEAAADFRKTTFGYDTYDNVILVEDANGNKVEAIYDGVDRPTTITDGVETDTVFTYLNKVLEEAQIPENNTPVGGTLSGNLRLGKIVYDSAGRPLRINRQDSSNSDQLRVGFSYDGFSQLRSLIRLKHLGLTSEAEVAHTAKYDRQGRVTESVDPNGKTSTSAYEPYCVGQATTSARGVRRKASFDSLCRLTQIEVGTAATDPLEVDVASETRTFEHDDLGRVIKSIQSTSSASGYGQARYGQDVYGSGATSVEEREYIYDSLDRLEKIIFEDDKEVSYLYDEEGNVTQITENASSASPKVTQFSYYGDGRLYQITYVRSGGNQVFTYAYDPGGRPLTLTYPSSTGVVAHFSGPNSEVGWDGNGQLKHLRYVKDGSTLIRRFEFDYDLAGNRISQLDVKGGTSPSATKWEYGYDWLDRLETVKKATGPDENNLGVLQLTSVYSYDASDNRTEFQVPNINPALTETFTYSYKLGDEIESVSKQVGTGSPVVIETFTSDDDGNLITRTDTTSSIVTTYSWTDFNRLASISTSDNSKKQEHTFAPNGFRRKKKDKNNVETTEYAAGLATAVSKAQGGETYSYLMGSGIMGFERESDGAMYYFLTDALSTVRDIINSSGTAISGYEFSEYGGKISPANTSGVESDKTYVGGMSVQDEVSETGLMMMGHRFYAPQLGRFLSRDPIGHAGGMNLYEYASSSPSSRVDPAGLDDSIWGPRGIELGGSNFGKDILESWMFSESGRLGMVSGTTRQLNKGQREAAAAKGEVAIGVYGAAMSAGVPGPEDFAISTAFKAGSKAYRAARAGKGNCPNYVYRNLAVDDVPANGLSARAPGATGVSPLQHVAGKRASPFISTSKTSKAALQFVKKGFHGQVRIDLSKVKNQVIDVSMGPFGTGARMLNSWARNAEEVLIRDFIPPEAIEMWINP